MVIKKLKGSIIKIKCSCCKESLTIHHDKHSLEINGVIGTIEEWRDVLLPLLHLESTASSEGKRIYVPTKPTS